MNIQDNDEKKKAIAISVTLQPDFLKEIDEAAASLRMKRVAFIKFAVNQHIANMKKQNQG